MSANAVSNWKKYGIIIININQIETQGIYCFHKTEEDAMAKRILLVDDEPLILKGLKFSLEQDGYETDTAADGEEALVKMQRADMTLFCWM